MGFSTDAVHAGQEPDEKTGAVSVPIYLTSTYAFNRFGEHSGYDYSRADNPTREALETSVAALEKGKFASAFSSGMAAIDTVVRLLSVGDHIVAADDLYGGTYRLFEQVVKRQGIDATYIDMQRPSSTYDAIRENTKMIFIETPTNPLMRIIDIAEVSKLANSRGILTVVDNTYASPYFQRPLELGADIVAHSTTKYIGGHSDIIGGVVVTSNEDIAESIKFLQKAVGAVPSPFDCWIQLRGIKTLALRMREHEKNADAVAKYLDDHNKIQKVYYPGLESHVGHEIAKKQMSGFGGMISFELENQYAAENFLNRLQLCTLGESLGGVETLVCHPASMTHASIPAARREEIGITNGLIRLSVGIEDKEDIIADLEQALSTRTINL